MLVVAQRMKIKELKNSTHTASRGRRRSFIETIWLIFECFSGGCGCSSMSAPIPLLPHNRESPLFCVSIISKERKSV